jgi:plasmid maintenance system antidote protein VapI
MKESSIFGHSSYKSIMKARLRAQGQRGALSRAAEALRCQRSFLSRIMNSKMQLTPDLAFKLCLHWKFSLNEREYFQTLVEHERAVDPIYAAFLREKIAAMRQAHESLSERAKRPAPTSSHDLAYFSGWNWTAIHFLTSIHEFQTVDAISNRLSLSKESVIACLEQLKAWGFVSKSGNRWEYKGGEYHLPKDSPLVILHHQNWRYKAVMDAQKANPEHIHFTNVHTISRAALPLLKERLLAFISETNELMKSSNEEDCVVLLCDLFRLS